MNSIALRQQSVEAGIVYYALYLAYRKKTTEYEATIAAYTKIKKKLESLERRLQECQDKLELERKRAYSSSEPLRRKYRKGFRRQRQANPYKYCRKLAIDLIVNEYDSIDDASQEYRAFRYQVESPNYSSQELEITIKKLTSRVRYTSSYLGRIRIALNYRRMAMLTALEWQNDFWQQCSKMYQWPFKWQADESDMSIGEVLYIHNSTSDYNNQEDACSSSGYLDLAREMRPYIPLAIKNIAIRRSLYRDCMLSQAA